jgi:RHS repeat-associated protein
MKKLFYFIVLLPIVVIGQTQTENYIKTTVYRGEQHTKPQINVTYFDGLGRPIQQIAHQQSGTGLDVVTPITYDGFGRQEKEYLPYVPTTTATLDYYSNALSEQPNFTQYNGQISYSQKLFEASPLNRVLKQAAPGNDWALASHSTNPDHTVKFDYQTNVEKEVKLYKALAEWSNAQLYDISFAADGWSYYPPNQLYKTITKDENWVEGLDHTTEEFKDKEGKVVLKRTYNLGELHDTYYVYDQYGNLTYVIPPMVTNVNSSTQLEGLCYQYKYDYRNRLVEKKLPGKQWEFIVYDKLDRVVATGPAFNPFGGTDVGWIITKYDAFNRPLYTGWYAIEVNATARRALQSEQNFASLVLLNEHKTTNSTVINNVSVYYSNTVVPTDIIVLTVNYYDDYNYPNVVQAPANVFGAPIATNVKGLATGSWVRILSNPNTVNGEVTTTYYDSKKYRPVFSRTTNYLGGYSLTKTKYSFDGLVELTETYHKRTAASDELKTTEEFEYSPQGRLVNHFHKVNTNPKELLAHNEYDALGQLTRKSVGGQDTTTFASLQKVDYQYNIRGWLTTINNVTNLNINAGDPTDLFAFKINYNQPEIWLDENTDPLYNGNISQTFWRTSGDNILRKYGYQYDSINRLSNSVYMRSGTIYNSYNENLMYDKNGNIMHLFRNGNLESLSEPAITIDDLSYSYYDDSNQLKAVDDGTNDPMGFKDGETGNAEDYQYDPNGNMKSDENKGIISNGITYNHLNLPTEINFGSNGTIKYLYDASGRKVKKTVSQNDIHTITDYMNGYQYVNNRLAFFPTAEGYVNVTYCDICDANAPKTLRYAYVYNYTDHLGNVRLSYGLDEKNEVVKIMEENHYYPFGLKHTNYNSGKGKYDFGEGEDIGLLKISQVPSGVSLPYKYKYNGKELQDELGLNIYAMDMRQYDPAIGRWMVIDPVTHHSESPYSAFNNNPVFWKDPSGADSSTADLINQLWNMTPNDGNAYTYIFGDPKKKTTTDAGHGDKTGCCVDPGTIDGTNYEKDYALKVEQSVNAWLNAWGIDNQSTRTGDIDKTGQKKIAWRLKAAKDHGSIIMVSIHIDSGGNDGLFAIYDKDNSESKLLAQNIANNYSFGLGDPDGIKEDVRNLGIVQRFSGKASVLLELGGIGNKNMRDRINTNSELMGYDIARGIYLYLNGTEPPASKTPSTNTIPWPEIFNPLQFIKF